MKIVKIETGITSALSSRIRNLPLGPKPTFWGPPDAMDSYIWETNFDKLKEMVGKSANLNAKN